MAVQELAQNKTRPTALSHIASPKATAPHSKVPRQRQATHPWGLLTQLRSLPSSYRMRFADERSPRYDRYHELSSRRSTVTFPPSTRIPVVCGRCSRLRCTCWKTTMIPLRTTILFLSFHMHCCWQRAQRPEASSHMSPSGSAGPHIQSHKPLHSPRGCVWLPPQACRRLWAGSWPQ